MVSARSAASRSMPSLTASVAWCTRKWIGTTGWSVVIASLTPARAMMPAARSVRLRSSTLTLVVNIGPMITGMFFSANRSAIRWPSVPWLTTSW